MRTSSTSRSSPSPAHTQTHTFQRRLLPLLDVCPFADPPPLSPMYVSFPYGTCSSTRSPIMASTLHRHLEVRFPISSTLSQLHKTCTLPNISSASTLCHACTNRLLLVAQLIHLFRSIACHYQIPLPSYGIAVSIFSFRVPPLNMFYNHMASLFSSQPLLLVYGFVCVDDALFALCVPCPALEVVIERETRMESVLCTIR